MSEGKNVSVSFRVSPRFKRLLEAAAARERRKSPTSTVRGGQYSEGLSLTLTASTSKAAGSKAPPIHALR